MNQEKSEFGADVHLVDWHLFIFYEFYVIKVCKGSRELFFLVNFQIDFA